MKSQLSIRPYEIKDKSFLIDLLRLNTPTYFGIEEEKDFSHYLDKEIQSYFVAEIDKQIVGCGGVNLNFEKQIGIISWGMIHPDFQGQKIGSKLLKYRIDFLKSNYNFQKIIVRTSQLVFPFYEKQGFELKEIHTDFWAKGIDMYLMELGNVLIEIEKTC